MAFDGIGDNEAIGARESQIAEPYIFGLIDGLYADGGVVGIAIPSNIVADPFFKDEGLMDKGLKGEIVKAAVDLVAAVERQVFRSADAHNEIAVTIGLDHIARQRIENH